MDMNGATWQGWKTRRRVRVRAAGRGRRKSGKPEGLDRARWERAGLARSGSNELSEQDRPGCSVSMRSCRTTVPIAVGGIDFRSDLTSGEIPNRMERHRGAWCERETDRPCRAQRAAAGAWRPESWAGGANRRRGPSSSRDANRPAPSSDTIRSSPTTDSLLLAGPISQIDRMSVVGRACWRTRPCPVGCKGHGIGPAQLGSIEPPCRIGLPELGPLPSRLARIAPARPGRHGGIRRREGAVLISAIFNASDRASPRLSAIVAFRLNDPARIGAIAT